MRQGALGKGGELQAGRVGDGTAAGFIPDTLDPGVYNQILQITCEEGYGTARFLARDEGVLVGISGGAAVAGMLRLGRWDAHREKVLLAILPDTGERYVSTDLWCPEAGRPVGAAR